LQPSGETPTMARLMFTSLLTCSDERCDHADAFVGPLEDAEAVLCDGCGCLMQVLAIEGAEQPPAVVLEFSAAAGRRRRLPALRAAA